jgi:hypothetical protein
MAFMDEGLEGGRQFLQGPETAEDGRLEVVRASRRAPAHLGLQGVSDQYESS